MSDYLARLKAKIGQTSLPDALSKPAERAFEGFEAYQREHILPKPMGKQRSRALPSQYPQNRHGPITTKECAHPGPIQNLEKGSFEGFEGDHGRHFGRPQTEDAAAHPELEERAAIIEEGSGARREWAEAFAQLDCARPPADVPSRRWRQFIDDCGRFLDDGWPARAIALGWKPLDLFGADRVKPFARVDQAGLLWLLNGRKLVALTATTATIETQTGARQTYRRCAGPADRALPRQLAQDILGSHGLARVHARSPVPPT